MLEIGAVYKYDYPNTTMMSNGKIYHMISDTACTVLDCKKNNRGLGAWQIKLLVNNEILTIEAGFVLLSRFIKLC